MEEPVPTTGPGVTPSWRHEPRGDRDGIRSLRLRRRTWILLTILAVAVGSLLGLLTTFRSHPYPAFLPIVVGRVTQPGPTVAFAEADLAALARRACSPGPSVTLPLSGRRRRSTGGSSGWTM